tara:strand:+ start:269 stop:655 length:387 start_codon:yes stop_codon:yes gene_type:complete
MYNLALFLHVISALGIGYVVLYGIVNSKIELPSSQFRLNLTLLPVVSLLSLLTGIWIIQVAKYSHGALWVSISYSLWIALIIINEVLLRRKYKKAINANNTILNVSTEYYLLTAIAVILVGLMIYKPV